MMVLTKRSASPEIVQEKAYQDSRSVDSLLQEELAEYATTRSQK